MEQANTNTGVTANASVGFKNPYSMMVVSIIKAAAVIIIVIFAFIIYRKIKNGLDVDYRSELKKIAYLDPNWYFKFYTDYKINPTKYSQKDVQVFLKNYDYSYDYFYAIGKDIGELMQLQSQWFNPYQMVKTAMGIFSSSGLRQTYGAFMLGAMKNIKSQIQLSMMSNRCKTETGYDLLTTINMFYDEDTVKEFYKYVKRLPLTVK